MAPPINMIAASKQRPSGPPFQILGLDGSVAETARVGSDV